MSKEIAESICSGDGDVSNCVSHIIRAFSDSLNVFKQIRKHRRRRRTRKNEALESKADAPSGAELQLSTSLRKGPFDIKQSFEDHYAKAGDRFAKGDAIAHASLTETLLKLNAGLVGIISAFLKHGSKTDHLHLDYKSLTNLSNASRAEAVNSLNHLYQRIGSSQLHVYHIGACRQCGSLKHQTCTKSITSSANSSDSEVTSKSKTSSQKRRPSNARLRATGPIVTKIPVKASSQPQLVMLRSKNNNHKKLPSSSRSSSPSKVQTAPVTSPSYAQPPGAWPLPQYTPKEPSSPSSKRNPPNVGRKRSDSFDGPRPTTWPHTKPTATTPFKPPQVTPYRLPPPPPVPIPPPAPKPQPPIPASPLQNPILLSPRRRDKMTPSMYTFASDSTKLGEIPQRNWTKPWDYEEAERLNKEIAANLQRPATSDDAGKGKLTKGKKGIFKFLRRGSKA
ncbi:hypothetical protein B0J11DRAFT_7745 [Dendryphion nanum]|uniref:Uncharacterized protein n=1 Tax=Dendryphion nanum TaxID=256645 RepID=A0A9P9EIL3_9PLEO|nr:hypothetical protein B0J11DRAFT_7745 [Dendryphion nanum]